MAPTIPTTNGTSISAQRFAAVLREHGNEVKILTTGELAPDNMTSSVGLGKQLKNPPQFALDGRSLFAPGRPKDLARAIDWWIDHPEEKERMEHEYAEFAK